jgi:flagellum-specific ATP synthase
MIYDVLDKFKDVQGEIVSGAVLSYDGRNITTDAFRATVGSHCSVMLTSGIEVFGEVIRVSTQHNVVSLYESFQNIRVGDRVSVRPGGSEIAVGNCLLGRVIDGQGKFIDAGTEIDANDHWPLHGKYINPVTRSKISEPLDVGVRSINAAMTVGKGQRIGVISGSGVGKSSLITMMTEYTDADIVVIGLIGERGREVADFVSKAVQLNNFENTIIVAEPANSSPLLRIKGAQRATAIAEYFRAKGKSVLLIIDSLTRVAHAQRQIGLSRGEATISKGYTSSVLDLIPNLIERAGTGTNGVGSITPDNRSRHCA